jgi:predicted MPP superfamily phosphohydrolase
MFILNIGDLHGRNNWIQWTEEYKDVDKIMFIGDYVDSFDISNVEILDNLKNIIEFKQKFSDKVILLLGNHK